MNASDAVAVAAGLFLAGFVVSIVWLNRRGRALCLKLESAQPDLYEKLGRPLPTTLPTERRMEFDEFIMQKRYETLLDPDLVRQFVRLRQLETRLLGLSVLVLIALGMAVYRLG